jgi:hypothetical protein
MKKYPIYRFSARWSQEGEWNENYPNHHKGLKYGRIWNGSSFTKIYKEEKSQDELDAIAREWYKNMVIAKKDTNHPIINPRLKFITAKYVEHNTWCLTWFSHETFDEGQTDAEVLASFEEYVREVENNNRHKEWDDDGYITLMGAEDRWRWCADGPETKPPCRCKHCKEQGMIRIGH